MSRFNPAADTIRTFAGAVAAIFLAGTCLTAAAGPAKAETVSPIALVHTGVAVAQPNGSAAHDRNAALIVRPA